MKKQTHTPGPWTISKRNENYLTIMAPEKPNGWQSVVASIHAREDLDYEADANLIAAAPELLHALGALFTHCNCDSELAKKARDLAAQAIKKAHGET